MRTTTPEPELAAQLLAWIDEDERVRAALAADGSLFDGYAEAMAQVHRRNAARLREVVAAGGFPGRSRVGEAAAEAAFRIVQHAIGEPAFMRAMLPLLREAAAAGELRPAAVAMLEDRICVFEGRAQRYGTQFDWDEAGTALVPMVGVESPHDVDARRAAVGLPPLAWRRVPEAGERPPRDRAARDAEAAAWAERVGWR
ncbi:MAG: hypothetical protein K1X88_03925 [Nannocystaceae bacterium]|nr:hypothetical protein [Nannocystaceae bacterium]